jgi:hypothetical protein
MKDYPTASPLCPPRAGGGLRVGIEARLSIFCE